MRIGIFSDTYTPQINGVVFVIDILRRNLTELGHEVFIFAPQPIKFKEKDPQVIRFKAIQGLFYSDSLTSMVIPRLVIRKIKKTNLDIILILTPAQIGLLGASAAKKIGVPLVCQYSTDVVEYVKLYPRTTPGVMAMIGVSSFSFGATVKEILGALKNTNKRSRNMETFPQSLVKNFLVLLHNSCDALISLSQKKHDQMKEWKITTRLETIPTGVDCLPVIKSRASIRKELKFKLDDKVILYVGRIASEKNLDLLIESFDLVVNKIPNAKLVLVGDFEYKRILEKRAKQTANHDKIVFTGALPHQELGSYYAMADVFAFPSLTDTQGLVLHEAAHAGLPLVLIDKKLNKILIPKKTGYFAKDNPNNFAKAIIKVLNLSPKEYAKMSATAKEEAQKYSEINQTKKMVTLFESLLESNKKPN